MSDIVDDSWDRAAHPILGEIAAAERRGSIVSDTSIAEATGLDKPTVLRTMQSLIDDAYINGDLMRIEEEPLPLAAVNVRLLPKGKQYLGLWR